MRIFFIITCLLFTTDTLSSSIYKCKQESSYIFSQMPCDDNDEKIQVGGSQSFSAHSNQQYTPQNNSTNDNPKLFILQQKKKRIQARIAQLNKKKAKKIAYYKDKATQVGKNRAGMLLEVSLYDEMKGIMDNLNQKITKEKQHLATVEQRIKLYK